MLLAGKKFNHVTIFAKHGLNRFYFSFSREVAKMLGEKTAQKQRP